MIFASCILNAFTLPLTPTNKCSVCPRYQKPIPKDIIFLQVIMVLYLKPHAFITSNASGIRGTVAHRNKTQFFSDISAIGIFLISSNGMVLYFDDAPEIILPPVLLLE